MHSYDLARMNAEVLPTVRLRELARFLNVPGNRDLERDDLLKAVIKKQKEILKTFRTSR